MNDRLTSQLPRIKVIGIGGAGCNAVARMIQSGNKGVEYVVADSDFQALDRSPARVKIQLGDKTTHGLGSSGDIRLGEAAARESYKELMAVLLDADMVFITVGLGRGTGTGAAPVVAEMARNNGALTIAIVTRPFSFEGEKCRGIAEEGITILQHKVDALIAIPNDRLLDICPPRTTAETAFLFADDTLQEAVQAITNVITVPGLINLDFADVRAILKDAGTALFSVALGSGHNRAAEAARAVVTSPLLDLSIDGARSVLFSVSGNTNLSLFEVNEVAEIIKAATHPDATIIFGIYIESELKDQIRVALVASRLQQTRKLVYLDDNSFYVLMGQRLKQARIEARKTQEECAKIIGLNSAAGYANYESGERRIAIPRLKILADYLERDLAYFLNVSQDKETIAEGNPANDSTGMATQIPREPAEVPVIPMDQDLTLMSLVNVEAKETPEQNERREPVPTLIDTNRDSIIFEVAQHFGITVEDMCSNTQVRNISLARQVAIYLLREHLGISFAAIGERLKRDPSTVFNSYKTIAAHSTNDDRLKRHLQLIRSRLGVSEL